MNKKLLLTAVTVTVLATGLFGISTIAAHAADNSSSSIVQKIAAKFGLNSADVQKVFDEEHAARETQMQAKMEERLNQLVTDKKITQDQKTLIQNKMKELETQRKSEMENMKNLTPEERRTKMEAKKTELNAWAKENNIDTQYLFFAHGMKAFGHGRMDQPKQ